MQALKYDHLVVTNINIISAPYSDVFDYLWKFLDLGQYYDSYYNPKYYTKSQCEQDYQDKCEALQELTINK